MKTSVWVAVDIWPESEEVIVAATRSDALREIVNRIGREAFTEFVSNLRGTEATDITYDDDPEAVLEVWAGPLREDDCVGVEIFGDTWKVYEAEIVGQQ